MKVSRIESWVIEQLSNSDFTESAFCEYLACQARLRDGSRVDRLLIFAKWLDQDFRYPPVYHPLAFSPKKKDLELHEISSAWMAQHHFPVKSRIDLENVTEIVPSTHAIAKNLVQKIYRDFRIPGPEPLYRFSIRLKDGRSLACEAPGIVDFLDLPLGVMASDVIDVGPFPDSAPSDIVREASHGYCHFDQGTEVALKNIDRHSEWELSPPLAEDLLKIEPSQGWSNGSFIRPARVLCLDGTVKERVIFELAPWRVTAYTLALSFSVSKIGKIETSSQVLPARWANAVYQNGPNQDDNFTLIFDNGSKARYTSGQMGYVDFIAYPPGLDSRNIVDIVLYDDDFWTEPPDPQPCLDYEVCYFTNEGLVPKPLWRR